MTGPDRTPDGHHIVVGDRRWRATDPGIPEKLRAELVAELMAARRLVRTDPDAARPRESTVQTFLPYPDFRRSAETLDVRRLGKQRVEGRQVIRGLTVPGYGWRHHPAVKMWVGHLEALGR